MRKLAQWLGIGSQTEVEIHSKEGNVRAYLPPIPEGQRLLREYGERKERRLKGETREE